MKQMPTASEAAWNWRDAAAQQEQAPRHALHARRVRSLRQALAMTAAGLLFAWVWSHPFPAAVLFLLAGCTVLGGWLLPRLYRGIERGLTGLVHAVGIGLAWLLLAPFFYVCFSAGRLWWRLRRHDRLQLTFPGGATSYWHPYATQEGTGRYRRQY